MGRTAESHDARESTREGFRQTSREVGKGLDGVRQRLDQGVLIADGFP